MNKSVLGGLSGTSVYNLSTNFGIGGIKLGGSAEIDLLGGTCKSCGKRYSDYSGIYRNDRLCNDCRNINNKLGS